MTVVVVFVASAPPPSSSSLHSAHTHSRRRHHHLRRFLLSFSLSHHADRFCSSRARVLRGVRRGGHRERRARVRRHPAVLARRVPLRVRRGPRRVSVLRRPARRARVGARVHPRPPPRRVRLPVPREVERVRRRGGDVGGRGRLRSRRARRTAALVQHTPRPPLTRREDQEEKEKEGGSTSVCTAVTTCISTQTADRTRACRS